MFDKLRSAFSNVVKSISEKELGEKDIEKILQELEISLLESDVATEVIDSIKDDLKSGLLGSKVDRNEVEKFVTTSLISSISSLFDAAGSIDLLQRIREQKERGRPFLILFVGINGTGKTTTLAKIAHMLQQAKFSVVVAAGDTFRAGAIEQLREHTNRLHLKLVAQNYNSDPAAVARDAVLYAKSHKTDCVLIDTAGRMQTSKNLMEQIEKITKVVNPDMKIFVGDSLAGNDTVNQAREFFEHVRFDGSILTKGDADAKGGAALSIVKITSTPVLYVGTGQEYKDLRLFDKKSFLKDVFGSLENVNIKDSNTSQPHKPEPRKVEPEPKPEPRKVEPEPKPEPRKVEPEPKPEPRKVEPEPKPEPRKVEPEPKPEPRKVEPEPKPEPRKVEPEPKPEPRKVEPEPKPEPRKVEPEPKPEPRKVEPEPKPEPRKVEPEPKPEPRKVEPEPSTKEPRPPQSQPSQKEPQSHTPKSDDPFEGINDDDIATYSDLFDIPPPENDREAFVLGNKIRKWINGGRLHPDQSKDEPDDGDDTDEKYNDNDTDVKPEKPKKRRGMFGLFRR